MLITPDGYQVGSDGAWIQGQNDGVHTMRASEANVLVDISIGNYEHSEKIEKNGITCYLLDDTDFTFRIDSTKNTIDPNGHEVWVVGYTFSEGIPFAIGDHKVYSFEYDKDYILDYIGSHSSAEMLSSYCKQNDLILEISVVDSDNFGVVSGNAKSLYAVYK